MNVFSDIKIADFSWTIVGPMTSRYFADYGATVVRVESERYPDAVRLSPPFKGGMVRIDHSPYFSNYNVNKLGITLDLKNTEALSVARRLIEWADIMMESFSPGTMERLSLDYASVRELNRRIIYVSSSMLGQTGPYRNFPGYGTHGGSVAGFNEITGWPDRPPVLPSPAYTDIVAARFLMIAIMEALFHRRMTGEGRYIDQSQVESALHFLGPEILDYQVNRRIARRQGNRDPYAAPHGAYRCAGADRWCVIAVSTDEEWHGFCQAIQKPELAKDPRFATLAGRKMHEDELDHLVEEWTIRFNAETVMEVLQESGVPAGVVQTAEDMHNDHHLKKREHFPVVDHPIIGPHTTESLPPRLSKTPARIRFRSPCMGEHNEYVCTKILGLSDQEFVRLFEAQAFG